MNDEQLQTVEFRGVTAKEKYNWIEEVLMRHHRVRAFIQAFSL